MTDRLCANCRFYGKPPPPGDDSSWEGTRWAGLGSCTYAEQVWDRRDYDADADTYRLTSARKAFVIDGSEYSATLLVAPDFGCIAFEPSTTTTEKAP